MPSFANATARIGYALQFFSRATALATFFLATYTDNAVATTANHHTNTTSNTTTTPIILPVYPTFWSQALLGTTHHTNVHNNNRNNNHNSKKQIQASNTTAGCAILAPAVGGRPVPEITTRPYTIVSLGGGPGKNGAILLHRNQCCCLEKKVRANIA